MIPAAEQTPYAALSDRDGNNKCSDSMLETVGHLLRASFSPVASPVLPAVLQALLDQLRERAWPPRKALADLEFKQLLTGSISLLRAYARKLCHDETLADDLVQDTMLKAWSARDRFEAGSNFKAWAYTILRNQFLSRMRRNRFVGEWDDVTAEIKLSAKADQEQRLHVEDVERAMAQLPEAQREALMLVGAGQMTYEEVAAITRVPLGTVKSRVARGRQALSRLVDGTDETDGSVAAIACSPAPAALETEQPASLLITHR